MTMATIRTVHIMASRIKTEPKLIPEFWLNVDGLDRLWSHFETEDEMVLEYIVTFGKSVEVLINCEGRCKCLWSNTHGFRRGS